MIPRPPRSHLFPYTTLFRYLGHVVLVIMLGVPLATVGLDLDEVDALALARALDGEPRRLVDGERSEEHTSELQSPDHLVWRLLLEKKNNGCQQPPCGTRCR